MLEALSLFSLCCLCGLVAVIVKLRARNRPRTREEIAHLREHLRWLEERRSHAQERKWDSDMCARLDQQIAETRERLGD